METPSYTMNFKEPPSTGR